MGLTDGGDTEFHQSVDEFTTGIPDHASLKEMLSAEGAPPYLVLDLGGSADLNADGIVSVLLGDDGELVFRDV